MFLGRYGIVIHGGIDDYSHVVTYLEVTDDNRIAAALAAFIKGMGEYGRIKLCCCTDR